MMKNKTYILTLLIICTNIVLGQKREIHIPTYEDGRIISTYRSNIELSENIGLSPVQESNKTFHFRLWTIGQVIEVWEEPNSNLSGMITSWTQEYDPEKEEMTGMYFYISLNLDNFQISSILSLYDSLNIKEIPDDSFIRGWPMGFDGQTYIFETADQTDYFFRTYWSPSVTDTTQEAAIISNFIEEASRLANATKTWEEFIRLVPYKCYSNGSVIACVYTEEEYKKMQKEE